MGVSHKIFAQFPAATATTAGYASPTVTVASNGRCAIVVVEQENRRMIEEGDGSFQRKLNNSQCPRCRCLIVLRRDEEHKREYECTGCKMRIIDVREQE